MEVVSHQVSSAEAKNNKLTYSSQEIPHKEADLMPWTPGFYAHKKKLLIFYITVLSKALRA